MTTPNISSPNLKSILPGSALLPLPDKAHLSASYVGLPLHALPTPACLVDLAVVRRNCARMAGIAAAWQVKLRVHVKTHKTAEGVREMLGKDGSGRVLISTLAEGWGLVRDGLVRDGFVKDILYGLPISEHKLDEIAALRAAVQAEIASVKGSAVRLFVDNVAQIDALCRHKSSSEQPWSVMVKVDHGARRAGLPPSSPALRALFEKISSTSRHISLHGIYAYGGHSYSSRSASEADAHLAAELRAVLQAHQVACDALPPSSSSSNKTGKLVLSVGTTPTAHGASRALQSEEIKQLRAQIDELGEGTELELHAGNYPMLDLQQLATKAQPSLHGEGAEGKKPARMDDVAISVLCSVVGSYPGRGAGDTSAAVTSPPTSSSTAQRGDEALIDGGGLAFSKDTGPWGGYGHVIWPCSLRGWELSRPSQEHGIMTLRGEEERKTQWVFDGQGDQQPRAVRVGEKVRIVPQHACMTFAAHPWFYVVDSSQGGSADDDDFGRRVVDVWVPWKGW